MPLEAQAVSCSIRSLFVAALVLSAGDRALASDGAALFQARCVACHGAQAAGNAGLQAPPLAGQDEAYLVRQLRQFRNRQRGGESPSPAVAGMQAVAQALPDDAAIDALARHLSRLKPPAVKASPPAAGSPQMAGKALYSVCMACHGSGGEGNRPLAAPRLNHLPAWYTLAQLNAYRSDQRGTHADDLPGRQMHQVAKEAVADDDAARAVAEYIATLGTGRH